MSLVTTIGNSKVQGMKKFILSYIAKWPNALYLTLLYPALHSQCTGVFLLLFVCLSRHKIFVKLNYYSADCCVVHFLRNEETSDLHKIFEDLTVSAQKFLLLKLMDFL